MTKEKTTDRLASAIESIEDIRDSMRGRRPAVFLDYDGTLTPIVERPELAVLQPDTKQTVEHLAALCPVAVISGRDLLDVRKLVGIEGIYYAGSHGFDIAAPDGKRIELGQGEEFLPLLDELEGRLRERLSSIDGASIERKRYSIAVHFRRVDPSREGDVERVVDEEVAPRPRIRKTFGKKVFDLQPKIDWHKGKALAHLLEVLGLEGPDVLPVFLGDDLTDEDAFRELEGRGIGVIVRDEARSTFADYALESPDEARQFLGLLADTLRAV